jgi:hypothetical protein
MPIDVNELTGVPIVKVYGKWESKTSALLRGEIKRLSDQKQTQLIVHIYQCDYEIVPVLQTLSALLKFLIEKNILIALVSEDDLMPWLTLMIMLKFFQQSLVSKRD